MLWRGYDGLVDVGFDRHYRVRPGPDEFVQGASPLNGIESFRSFAKAHLQRFKGVAKHTFLPHLKEAEFCFNHRHDNQYELLVELLRQQPLVQLPMSQFLSTLAVRNAPLCYFGWACLAGTLVCAVLSQLSRNQVTGVNAWVKPLKFFVSLGLFAWTMGWFLGYLGPRPAVAVYTWVVVGALAFELLCIVGQAARGQPSHYNVSSPFSAALFAAMGVVIVIMTLWTAYMGLLFCQAPLPGLPPAYAWAIRLGIGLFVVFALQGGLMVSRQAHTVGGPDGGPGLPVLGWSTRHGDLRVAHFVGMHALQVLPLLAWYGRLSVLGTGLVALLYGGLAVAVLVLALQGRAPGYRAPAAAPVS